ncbi:lycopene cyclase domain-containing protein [Algoriphagus aestuariicola]|jgi:lycopene cyclase domain-containing protein|uniref:Lycopene cyclase domain-containing protein n=1 Tax=Algoriphagus aestuariicola TaxID=1852016 RepID=A0ABS3BVR9_9BACT|nr:lycopene cyclase domain-containing protein [Algoriphagus aestuariicola]MBN7802401.1 lycopene cyclase domain-containing protein [Algoriphagus aestuariicola]
MEKYLYSGVLLFAVSYPLAQSFEHRIRYSSQWYALMPALLISAAVFLVWDYWFTQAGVWEFNPLYVLGVFLYGLPLEEILFFFAVPFACVFIYEVLNYYFPKDFLLPFAKPFVYVMIPSLLGFGLLHLDKLYTSVNFLFGAAVLLLHFLVFGDRYLGRFLFAYLVHLIPFIICNGILTGGLTPEPVVIYNNAENLDIRIWTVPIEDTVYSMSLLLLNISIYEKIRSRKQLRTSKVYRV